MHAGAVSGGSLLILACAKISRDEAKRQIPGVLAAPGCYREFMSSTQGKQIQERLLAWKTASGELTAMRAKKLMNLTEAEAARWFDDLGCLPGEIWRSTERRDGSGLVEQQRLFAKLRTQTNGG